MGLFIVFNNGIRLGDSFAILLLQSWVIWVPLISKLGGDFVEDRPSNGSDGSSVVDDQKGPQVVDSRDSYFSNNYYMGCVAIGVEGIQSEEEDGSDDGGCYFSNLLVAAEEQQQQEEVKQLGWYICLRSNYQNQPNIIRDYPTIVRDPIIFFTCSCTAAASSFIDSLVNIHKI
ncbi:unnamed protein product [Fraxinus pennsylvanica]|uniref:Uncharacterized protein n=1 Tax=Fraxinus pennsylvanica TaxID=56036 RepID=A0AAD2EFX5_9LAMI|nr:unnamed protein product [Fraxinus pennsylvanica]